MRTRSATGRPPRSRRAAVLAAAVLGLECGLALVGVYFVASLGNTLRSNGRWVSTKATLTKSVMGGRTFANSRQTLAREHLNLGRWNGFQEVLVREPLALEEVELRFRLAPEAHFTLVFGRTEAGFAGLRISRHPAVRSLVFEADPDGAFTAVTEIDPGPVPVERWVRLRASFESERVACYLDDEPLGTFAVRLPERHVFGFRAGLHAVWVDDVRVRHDGGAQWSESFANTTGFAHALALALAFLLAVDVVLLLAVRRLGLPSARTAARLLAAAVALLALAGLGAAGYRALLANDYPAYDPEQERAWVDREAREIVEATAAYRGTREPGTVRVLFVGTSQTWGAGADAEDATFPSVCERLLNERAGGGRRIECVNAGISGARAPLLFELYRDKLLDLEPDVVVVDLSNNDDPAGGGDARAFAAALLGIGRLNAERGIATLFSLEPNSIELRPEGLPLHAAVRRVASTLDVPVVDTHAYLRARADTGWLWWDFVHPTNYGHRLIAECLVPPIERCLDR